MKKIFLTIAVLLIISVGRTSAQDEKVRIAVFDPSSPGTGIDEGTKVAIRELISSTYVNTDKYIIVERSLLEKVMREQEFSNSGVVDDNQATEIGKLAGAHKVVVSIVTLTGTRNMLSVKIIDVKTATIDQQKTKLVRSDELLDIVEPLAQELIDVAISIQSAPSLIEPLTQELTQELTDVATDIQSAPNLSSQDVEPVHNTDIPVPLLDVQRNGDTCNPDSIELVYVAGMDAGSANGFYIGKYEITQAQWEAIMDNNPSKKQDPSYPVTNVNWNDVQQFLAKLGEKTGRIYRLPTETEWEYAANGGSNGDTYEYAGSDQIDDVAWYGGSGNRTIHEVGTKQANSAGIYDMSGNVWEWCENWYDDSHSGRTLRGGGWSGGASYCRVSDRMSCNPDTHYSYLGFRVALIVSLPAIE